MKLNKLSELLPDTFRYTVFIFNPYLESHVETNLVQGFSEISKDNKFTIMAIRFWNSTIGNRIVHAGFEFLEVLEEQKQDIYWIYLEDLKKLWSNEDVNKTK